MPIEVVPHIEFLEAIHVPSKIRHLSPRLTNIKIAMAYVKKEGFRLLADSLRISSTRNFSKSGLKVKFLVGLSEKHFITDYEPLQQLINTKRKLGSISRRLQIRYYNDTHFHPKMFILANGKEAAVIVGSSNITKGGLKTNREANFLLEAETDHNAIQDANEFFDLLWKYARKLTRKEVEIYTQDKKKCEKTGAVGVQSGRLLASKLPSRLVRKKEELFLFIEDYQYPLSKVRGYCTECGRPTSIPSKWLKYWRCERHGKGRHILKRKANMKINIKFSGRRIKNIKKVEGVCLHKLKDGNTCDARFSIESDLSHQICRQCYEGRRKQKKPCSRIPRTNLDESFFYDTHKKMIIAS